MEEAYSGENHRGGALEKAVHGEGLRQRRELHGGLEGASQKLGSGAKKGSWMDGGARGVVDWSMAHGFARIWLEGGIDRGGSLLCSRCKRGGEKGVWRCGLV